MGLVGEESIWRYLYTGGPDPYSESLEKYMSRSTVNVKLFLTSHRQYADVPAGVSPEASIKLLGVYLDPTNLGPPYDFIPLAGSTFTLDFVVGFEFVCYVSWGYMEALINIQYWE